MDEINVLIYTNFKIISIGKITKNHKDSAKKYLKFSGI